jgi:uncharacterized protein YcaQ
MLAPPRTLPADPSSVLRVFARIGTIQFDPLDICGRNHDLVLLSRIAGYRREWTDALLYRDRVLYETYNKGLSIVPTAEMPFYRLTWDLNRIEHEGTTFDTHAPLVEELLERIRSTGPMSATDVPSRAAIDWYWRPTNQVRAILEALAQAGILGLARRDGNRRVYDLVERLFPARLLAEGRPPNEQWRHKLLSRYRAHGLLGTSGWAELWYGTGRSAADRAGHRTALVETGTIVPVEVHGLKGTRFILADGLPLLDQAEREVADRLDPNGQPPGATFLAPLDPLVWDRDLLRRLFGFDYIWEVYVPEKKRRWGYYVLPILFGDRFVGRIEPKFDRQSGVLRIVRLWWEDGVEPLAVDGLVDAVAAALEAHRAFTGAERIALPRLARHRAFVAALRELLEAAPRRRARSNSRGGPGRESGVPRTADAADARARLAASA